MFDIKRKTIDWAGRPLTLETGRIARQADGAVLATYGETVVLATVVYGRAPKPGLDFFPLTVNYQEKTFAAGKIPGGYFKREGRPTRLRRYREGRGESKGRSRSRRRKGVGGRSSPGGGARPVGKERWI